MFPLLLVLATTPISEAAELETPILPPNAYLVKARVVKVGEVRPHAADFVIEQVYAGDKAMTGQRFTLSDYLVRPGSRINSKDLPLRLEGEVGLWWIGMAKSTKGQDAAKLFSYHDHAARMPWIYHPFPAVLKGGTVPDPRQFGELKTDPYDFGPELMVHWAEAIEKVYGTKGDDARIALLKKLATSDNPPLSGWAVSTLSRFLEENAKRQLFTPKGEVRSDCELLLEGSALAKHVRKDVKAMLEDFAGDPALSIYAQTELDRVLTRVEGDDWRTSERRKTMLQRWKEVKDPIDRYFIGVRLDEKDASR